MREVFAVWKAAHFEVFLGRRILFEVEAVDVRDGAGELVVDDIAGASARIDLASGCGMDGQGAEKV
jgi:hypothetical protein